MGFNPGESNEDNVNERREEIEEGETQRTDNQDNTQVNESKENETQTHVSDYVEREEMEVEHEENHNNGEDSLTSGFTNLTEEVEDRQLVELINAKRGDPDLDSIHRPGEPKRDIHNIMEDDQVSVASSITTSSIESQNSNYSDFTQYSNDTEISGTDDESRKIARLADAKMTDEEIKIRSKQDFQHKMTKLELLREAAVEKFIAQRNENKSKKNGKNPQSDIVNEGIEDNNSTATPKTNTNKKKTRTRQKISEKLASGKEAGQEE